MGRRFLSLSLSDWAVDRFCRARGFDRHLPLVLLAAVKGGLRLHAVNGAAAASGLAPGMTLSDARALLPGIVTADSDVAGDLAALTTLADWCSRFSPWVAPDGNDGIVMDISGVAHLFGGEGALRDEVLRHFHTARIHARVAIAEAPAGAWAMARFSQQGIVDDGTLRAALAPLPLAALRLDDELIAGFGKIGVRTIGGLYALPRGGLARRFGAGLIERLDKALGHLPEPIEPLQPVANWRTRLAFAEPIGTLPDIELACKRLIARLLPMLEQGKLGARRVELALYRVDNQVQRLVIGTSRPSRDAAHLFRLFEEQLDRVEPGFGIETMILSALAVERVASRQIDLQPDRQEAGGNDLAALVDRLAARLGPAQVMRLVPVQSHQPERAVRAVAALEAVDHGPWAIPQARPIRLLPCAEPVEVEDAGDEMTAPESFRWRRVLHRVVRAEGPERIEPEWWRSRAEKPRDYFRLTDAEGRRYWLYRDLAASAWYLHGLF